MARRSDAAAPKVAVVTGSAKGIGRGIASALAQAGHRVVINYRSSLKSAKEAVRALPGAVAIQADVSTPAGARRLVRSTLKELGRIDVLVNNVGDFFPTPAGAMELEKWDRIFDSNLRSALFCTREALPAMRRRKSGLIVNIGGTATNAIRGNKNYAAYVMAKTALAVFSKSLAQAEAANGIRVNIVNPGYIRTHAYTDRDVRELAPSVPAKRLGTPEEVGALIAFLTSDAAAYVNGASIDVGGGLWV